MASVSVVIPNYNRAGLIGETLESILSQTRPVDEIIVVDDGSTDDSIQVVESFAPRVRLIAQPNAGPAAARNRGFAASTGDFLQFFDSDDLCAPNKIELQLAALRTSGADIAYSAWLQATLTDGVAEFHEPPLQQGPLPPWRRPESWFLRGWVTVFQTLLIRRTLLERIGPYREDLMPSEDSELLFRFLLAGARMVHVPGTLVLYRRHPAAQISGTSMGAARRARDWLKFTKAVMAHIEARPDIFSIWERFLWRQETATAEEIAAALPDAAVNSDGPSRKVRWSLATIKRLRGIARRVSRRLSGVAFPHFYAQGDLTEAQATLVRGLGYEPRKIGRRIEGAH